MAQSAAAAGRAAHAPRLRFTTPTFRWVPPTIFRTLEPLTGKRKVRDRMSLYEQLACLPGQGVGMRIYKKQWYDAQLPVDRKNGCYWHVVKTEFDIKNKKASDAIKHAWGIKYWKGVQQTPPHTIVQIEDPDASWFVVDDTDRGLFYRAQDLAEPALADFGTDPETATLMDPPAPPSLESDPLKVLGKDPQVDANGYIVQPDEVEAAREVEDPGEVV